MTPNEQEHFARFLDKLDDYLYSEGWYTNGRYIKQRCRTYGEVETYLHENIGYSKTESAEIVARIKLQTL